MTTIIELIQRYYLVYVLSLILILISSVLVIECCYTFVYLICVINKMRRDTNVLFFLTKLCNEQHLLYISTLI